MTIEDGKVQDWEPRHPPVLDNKPVKTKLVEMAIIIEEGIERGASSREIAQNLILCGY